MSKPLTLCEFLADEGGLRLRRGQIATVGAGELRAMDAALWHTKRPFTKKLIRENKGLCPDDAALRAWEAGYFPSHRERPDLHTFLEAVEADLRGASVYSERDYELLERLAIQELNEMDAAAADIRPALAMEPRRVIPMASVARHGIRGDVAYLYQQEYVNRKGKVGILYHAKAFACGEVKAAWHKSFRSEQEREDALNAWFCDEWEFCE